MTVNFNFSYFEHLSTHSVITSFSCSFLFTSKYYESHGLVRLSFGYNRKTTVLEYIRFAISFFVEWICHFFIIIFSYKFCKTTHREYPLLLQAIYRRDSSVFIHFKQYHTNNFVLFCYSNYLSWTIPIIRLSDIFLSFHSMYFHNVLHF
jgi:hypothetical protein